MIPMCVTFDKRLFMYLDSPVLIPLPLTPSCDLRRFINELFIKFMHIGIMKLSSDLAWSPCMDLAHCYCIISESEPSWSTDRIALVTRGDSDRI